MSLSGPHCLCEPSFTQIWPVVLAPIPDKHTNIQTYTDQAAYYVDISNISICTTDIYQDNLYFYTFSYSLARYPITLYSFAQYSLRLRLEDTTHTERVGRETIRIILSSLILSWLLSCMFCKELSMLFSSRNIICYWLCVSCTLD